MENEKDRLVQETFFDRENKSKNQGADAAWQELTAKERLARWKTITTRQFDALTEEDRQSLLKEWNELVEADSEHTQEKLGSLEHLRSILIQVEESSVPSVQSLREALKKDKKLE